MSMAGASHVGEESMVIPTEPIWRLTVQQYHQMIRAGILTEDDHVELLQGWLVTKMPKNRAHSLSTQMIGDALAHVVPAEWYVDRQEPITTSSSEPEPDVLVVRGQRREYRDRHPGPDDVALIVEVADATLARDQGPKKRLYASVRIPVYWIVNLIQQQIEVYQDPAGSSDQSDYQSCHIYRVDDSVPVFLDGREIARFLARDILP